MGKPKSVTRGPKPTKIVVNDRLKVHPAIGAARVGNHPTDFFLGPEIPGKGNVGADAGVGTSVSGGAFSGFKTDATTVKRQGQRFYLFLHLESGPPIEVNLLNSAVKSIEWFVRLANKKAAFFEFNGQKGNSGSVYTPATPRRNIGEPDSQLIIDPGKAQTISGKNQGPKKIDSSMGGSWPKHQTTGAVVIDLLGELFTDSAGRLIVVGGRGLAKPFKQAGGADPPINHYANNDGWLDDVSDGIITAKVTMKNDFVTLATPGWILIGPPDYAPEIGQVVSMYDTLWDVAAQNTSIPIPNIQMFKDEPLNRLVTFRNNLASYKPEWFADLEPFLRNTVNQAFVNGGVVHSMPSAALASKAESGLLQFVRPAGGNLNFDMSGSPPACMPFLMGDEPYTAGSNFQALSVTKSQWENLQRWKAGNFDTLSAATAITPQGLDRAALESCVGGAFYPGIEASWMIRNPALYLEPFRFKAFKDLNTGMTPALRVEPGFLSQQMALPWHADFYACKDDNPRGVSQTYGWWPAQRPIVVTKAGARWDRGLAPSPPHSLDHLVLNWNTRGFVVQVGSGFQEQGGP